MAKARPTWKHWDDDRGPLHDRRRTHYRAHERGAEGPIQQLAAPKAAMNLLGQTIQPQSLLPDPPQSLLGGVQLPDPPFGPVDSLTPASSGAFTIVRPPQLKQQYYPYPPWGWYSFVIWQWQPTFGGKDHLDYLILDEGNQGKGRRYSWQTFPNTNIYGDFGNPSFHCWQVDHTPWVLPETLPTGTYTWRFLYGSSATVFFHG